ncbi:hypothetical protein, partial [Microbacterium sp. ZXX196]|uniref:hypothetical protein n=1 Tax=Microbacterium sp. ZXX196 TaxID=2609291 RepID=UPI00132AFEFC
MLMLLAGIGAVAVAFVVISYTGNLQAELGETTPVLRLTDDVNPHDEITPDHVEVHEIHTSSTGGSDDFVRSEDELVN